MVISITHEIQVVQMEIVDRIEWSIMDMVGMPGVVDLSPVGGGLLLILVVEHLLEGEILAPTQPQ